MTVDNALLPRDGWAGSLTDSQADGDRDGYWKRRRNEPIRAHKGRVTCVTAFMHTDGTVPHLRLTDLGEGCGACDDR